MIRVLSSKTGEGFVIKDRRGHAIDKITHQYHKTTFPPKSRWDVTMKKRNLGGFNEVLILAFGVPIF